MAATYCERINGNYSFEIHLFEIIAKMMMIVVVSSAKSHTKLELVGWMGKVTFKETDEKYIIIDNTEFAIPSEYLVDDITLKRNYQLKNPMKVII